jgi:hypothetical protein
LVSVIRLANLEKEDSKNKVFNHTAPKILQAEAEPLILQ